MLRAFRAGGSLLSTLLRAPARNRSIADAWRDSKSSRVPRCGPQPLSGWLVRGSSATRTRWSYTLRLWRLGSVALSTQASRANTLQDISDLPCRELRTLLLSAAKPMLGNARSRSKAMTGSHRNPLNGSVPHASPSADCHTTCIL